MKATQGSLSEEVRKALSAERFNAVQLAAGELCVIHGHSLDGDPSPLIVWVVAIEDAGAVGGVRFEVLAKREFGEIPSQAFTCTAPRKKGGGEG